MNKSISDLFFANGDKCIDKWEHYLPIYESELNRFIESDTPVRLLEIGVQNGGSLELWRSVLPEHSIIMGIDIDPKIADLKFASDRVGVRCLDATSPSAITDVLGDQQFDIIIDDGSHITNDVIKSFQVLFNRLAPDGKYIIEDLHCSYYASHEGGYRKSDSSIEFLKGMVDAINFDHISPVELLDADSVSFLSLYNTAISRVVFYDSICVISKLGQQKNRPYRRVRSGSQDHVQSYKSWIPLVDPDLVKSMIFNIDAKNTFERNCLYLLHNHKKNEESLRAVTDNQDIIINAQRKIIDSLKIEIDQLRRNSSSVCDE